MYSRSPTTGGSTQVVFSDGASAAATIIGRDALTDLAVVRVDTGATLRAVRFGSSATVRIGEPVIAAGAPLGLSSTVTAGIVSATGRTVHVPADNGKVSVLLSAIQTDAAINPGNSGGALLDCAGELIGVNTAIATLSGDSGSIGLGFAIPADLARAAADQLIATGAVSHSYIGLEVTEIPPTTPGQGAAAGLARQRGRSLLARPLSRDCWSVTSSSRSMDSRRRLRPNSPCSR